MRRQRDCAGLVYPACPKCASDQVARRGLTPTTRRQRFRCKDCRYVWTPGRRPHKSENYKAAVPIAPIENGAIHEALLTILIDEFHSLQSGPYACDDNTAALVNCEAALYHLRRRPRDRTQAGLYLERIGGPDEIQENLAILERRVRARTPDADIRDELLQMACLDVLDGGWTCESVRLQFEKARRNARGNRVKGSDHPMYRLHNGQKSATT